MTVIRGHKLDANVTQVFSALKPKNNIYNEFGNNTSVYIININLYSCPRLIFRFDRFGITNKVIFFDK